MIPRSRRNLFSFGDNDNAITKADKWPAGGALHAKKEWGWEEERTGNGAAGADFLAFFGHKRRIIAFSAERPQTPKCVQ